MMEVVGKVAVVVMAVVMMMMIIIILMIARLPAKGCAIHTLTQHFDGKLQAGSHVDVIFEVLLQDALRRLVVRPDCGRLPTAVVARGIRLKQLETKMLVPARDEKRNAERPQASESEEEKA